MAITHILEFRSVNRALTLLQAELLRVSMNAPLPSAKALVPFVSVENMMRLIHHVGLETILRELADRIEADFRRWESFDMTPRVASHSRAGVIELMPTS